MQHLDHYFNDFKFSTVKFGIFGDDNFGKSALVNTLRGLSEDDSSDISYAKPHHELMMEPRTYRNLKNQNISYAINPGLGRSELEGGTEVATNFLQGLDMCIFVIKDDMREEDWKIFDLCRQLEKPVVVVTNSYVEESEGRVSRKVKDMFHQRLQNKVDTKRDLFFVSFALGDRYKYDFPKFQERVYQHLLAISKRKANAFVRSMDALTPDIAENQKKLAFSTLRYHAAMATLYDTGVKALSGPLSFIFWLFNGRVKYGTVAMNKFDHSLKQLFNLSDSEWDKVEADISHPSPIISDSGAKRPFWQRRLINIGNWLMSSPGRLLSIVMWVIDWIPIVGPLFNGARSLASFYYRGSVEIKKAASIVNDRIEHTTSTVAG